ncbi:MAG: hypothetical protein D6688_14740 [Alphaproteobacteria bacterium]|nr:MAG: hypothetical protein D6688_14740 [Alphaproteobacteria bacterium]
MRNAAQILGVIAGVIGMIVGFFSYGYVSFIEWFGEVPDVAEQVRDPMLIKTVSLLAPILSIAGGAMARARPIWAGGMLIVAAAGMFHAFDFNAFTMFPIAMAGLAGVLALAAAGAGVDD